MRTLVCSICNKNFTTNHSRQKTCSKECSRISGVNLVKQWRKENPSSLKSGDLKKRYWPLLSNEEALAKYHMLLQQQENKCAICNQSETSKDPLGKTKELAVDHCHSTGRVRGLLCSRCNTAVGLLRDNAQTARNLAAYLVT